MPLTARAIAERLSVPVHRINYTILRHGIKPEFRIGNTRIFRERDATTVARMIGSVDQRRCYVDETEAVRE